MRKLMAFAIVTLVASVAHAAPTVYTTVDAFERGNAETFSITGIVSGQSAPQTDTYLTAANSSGASAAGDGCERAALMMMNRPGRYTLEVRGFGAGQTACKLVKQ